MSTPNANLDQSLDIHEDDPSTNLFTQSPFVDGDSESLIATLTLSDKYVGILTGADTGSDGIYTVSGTVEEINEKLAAIKFDSSDNFNGQATVSISIHDTENPNNIEGTVTINVAPENDLPIIQGNLTNTATEDQADSTHGILTVDDPDSDDESHFLVQTNASGTYGNFSIDADGKYTYDLKDIAQSLSANDTVSDTFKVETIDHTTKDVVITITGVDDAPVNTVPATLTGDEDTAITITGISVADVDAGSDVITTTLTVEHGAISVEDVDDGANVTGNGSGSVTLTGTLEQINSTLSAEQNIIYQADENYNGSDLLTVKTSDGSQSTTEGLSDLDTVNITIGAVNDAPEITSNNGMPMLINVAENMTEVTTVVAKDVDSGDVDSDEKISFSISGGADAEAFKVDEQTGKLSFNEAPDFETLNGKIYEVVVSATDSHGVSDTQSISVNITDVDDTAPNAPIFTAAEGFGAGISEDTKVGTVVGTLTSEAGATFTIEEGSSFALDANDTVLSDGQDVILAKPLDYETASSTSFSAITTDTAHNVSQEQSFDIDVVDASEPGTGKNDKLFGTEKADTIDGLAGDDTIDGRGGDDSISGSAGNDLLTGGEGSDTLRGGDNDDILTGVNLPVENSSMPPMPPMSLYFDDDVLDGGKGNDKIYASYGDTVTGGTGTDEFHVVTGLNNLVFKSFDVVSNSPSSLNAKTALTITDIEDGEKISFANLNGTGFSKDTTATLKDGILTIDADGKSDTTEDQTLVALLGTAKGEVKGQYVLDSKEGQSEFGHFDVTYHVAAPSGGGGGGGSGPAPVPSSPPVVTPNPDGSQTVVISGPITPAELAKLATPGVDNVQASVSLTLPAGIENVELTGTGNIDATGNDGDNQIVGNVGNNVLSGDGPAAGGALTAALDAHPGSGVIVDAVEADTGADTLYGAGGADTLNGGHGDDILFGGDDNDQVFGGIGNDKLFGGAGDDQVYGGQGDDQAYGGAGTDQVFGGTGSDTVGGGIGNDVVGGGENDDQVYGGDGDDQVYGGTGNDVMLGGAGADTLVAGDGADTVYAGAGHDIVYAAGGNDLVYGGEGDDTLWGGAGNDTLFGGAGADRFSFANGSGTDVIEDFNAADGDRLNLEGQTYTVGHAADGDVVLTLSGGGTVTLDGVHDFDTSFLV